jgi:hypothetical protein
VYVLNFPFEGPFLLPWPVSSPNTAFSISELKADHLIYTGFVLRTHLAK